MNRCLALGGLIMLALAGCTSATTGPPPPVLPSTFSGTAGSIDAPGLTPSSSASPGVKYPASWTLPDKTITTRAVQPGYTIRDICPRVNPQLESKRPTSTEKALVYKAYHITHRAPGQYEIDHLVPIELLGLVNSPAMDVAENLWPEPNDTPDPAMIAKYHLSRTYVHNSKDLLEDVLHRDVCSGQVQLATAQKSIATDWRAAYVTYVGPPPRNS